MLLPQPPTLHLGTRKYFQEHNAWSTIFSIANRTMQGQTYYQGRRGMTTRVRDLSPRRQPFILIWPRSKAGPGEKVGTGPFLTLIALPSFLPSFHPPIMGAAFCFSGSGSTNSDARCTFYAVMIRTQLQ